MNALLHALAPFGSVVAPIVEYFVDALWMGAVIVALTAIVVRLWKPLDAAARHMVWYAALCVVAVGPIVMTVARHWLPLGARVTVSVQPWDASASMSGGVGPSAFLAHAAPGITVPAAFGIVAVVVWLIVTSVGALRIAAGAVVLARLKRDALPLSPDRRGGLPLWGARADAGARRSRLCVSDRVEVPLAVGLFDGMVVIPEHVLDAFEPDDIDRFVLHELAHLERRDDWTALVQRLVQAAQWFNPAVHFIARRLDLEREIACDDRVIAATHDVRSYAVGLTRMAESTAWPHHGLAAPAIFVTRKQLSLRVEQLLTSRRLVAPRVVLAPAIVALAASACVVAAASPFSPSFALAGAQTPESRTAQQPNFFILEQARSTTLNGERRRVVYVRDVLQKVGGRWEKAPTPEQIGKLVKSIEDSKGNVPPTPEQLHALVQTIETTNNH